MNRMVVAEDLDTEHDNVTHLRGLRERLLLMSGYVERMIADAVRALTERDARLAEETIVVDHHVNRAEMEIDELCIQILSRYRLDSPDMRFVTLALKMVTDLERMGDLAVNICERAIDLSQDSGVQDYREIPRMAQLVQSMLHRIIDAFVSESDADARAVISQDDELDDLYTKIFTELLVMMGKDPASIRRCVHIQSVAKWLERMGDHATNIAEQVIFWVKGQDVRHEGKV